ncbi:formate dehydrogenase accessory protein FdhE [Paracandidimonas soli]|uniref:formate dehydrogenase accessory protein FdhE n=1 Tax=Paracandidimonas soli TaxID=1917182 RepID=UPI0033417AB5
MSNTLQPDPSLIGGVPEAPLAFLPDPVRLFQTRAKRFSFLAESSNLSPYLKLLAEISSLQARLSVILPAVEPVGEKRRKEAATAAMPPIDRMALADDPQLIATLAAFCDEAAGFEMPEQARDALAAVQEADDEDRRWLLSNVLSDNIPEDSAAPHLFASAAVQIHMARLAATLDAGALVRISTGVCPSCGGRPVSSSVMGTPGIENVRYATCSCCATQWNEVRVKCLCCGSTKGISYRSVETHEATVKAETCAECNSWVKIFYQVKNASLDPVADDVGSIGLDMLMKDSGKRKYGLNPFIAGY